MFPDEPYRNDLVTAGELYAPQEYTPSFSYDILAASNRQKSFFYQVKRNISLNLKRNISNTAIVTTQATPVVYYNIAGGLNRVQ